MNENTIRQLADADISPGSHPFLLLKSLIPSLVSHPRIIIYRLSVYYEFIN